MKNLHHTKSLFLLLLISFCWILPQEVVKAEHRYRKEQRVEEGRTPQKKIRQRSKPKKADGGLWGLLSYILLWVLYGFYILTIILTIVLVIAAGSRFLLSLGLLLLIAPIVCFAIYLISPSENSRFLTLGVAYFLLGLIVYGLVAGMIWLWATGLIGLVVTSLVFRLL